MPALPAEIASSARIDNHPGGRNNPPALLWVYCPASHEAPHAVQIGVAACAQVAQIADKRTGLLRVSKSSGCCCCPIAILPRSRVIAAVAGLVIAIISHIAMGQEFVAPDGSAPTAPPAVNPPLSSDQDIDPDARESPDAFFGPSVEEYGDHEPFDTSWSLRSFWPPTYCLDGLTWLGLRHSSTYGRHVGLGGPLVGTSWLNRPYYVGAELGELWIMRSQGDDISRDADVFGGIFFGWDWDHYWGSELRSDWATPELINSEHLGADRADSLFAWSVNAMYYPWGDSRFRPFWRWGLGGTHFDFPVDDDQRRDEWLFTMPIGVGLKYPLRHWLAVRTEFTDQFSIGSGGLPTQHNLTLTFGLECRYGVHPKSYWPWNPSRHIW
jgi:hypothetical protein